MITKILKNQKIGIKGEISTFRLRGDVTENTKIGGVGIFDLLRQYQETGNKKILKFLRDKNILLGETLKQNLIVTAGLNVLCRLLAADVTYSGAINYGAVGTAVTPVPVVGDTQLGTELFRNVKVSAAASGNIAYVDFVYAAGDWNGTATEFANFIDGTGAANSGQMFSYIATGGWVKSAAESLFVSCKYTIN